MIDTTSLIRVGDFVTFKKNIGDDEFSVVKGTRGYVAGVVAVPEKESDPYTQRIKFYINLINEDNHLLPDKFFIVDPKSVKKVKKNAQEILTAQLQLDFGEDGDGSTTH